MLLPDFSESFRRKLIWSPWAAQFAVLFCISEYAEDQTERVLANISLNCAFIMLLCQPTHEWFIFKHFQLTELQLKRSREKLRNLCSLVWGEQCQANGGGWEVGCAFFEQCRKYYCKYFMYFDDDNSWFLLSRQKHEKVICLFCRVLYEAIIVALLSAARLPEKWGPQLFCCFFRPPQLIDWNKGLYSLIGKWPIIWEDPRADWLLGLMSMA